MDKLWLKITGIAVLALVAIVVVTAFWPAENVPMAESRDMKQIQKEDKSDLKRQQVVQQPQEKQVVEPAEPKRPKTIEQAESNSKAEKLYQIALFYKEPGDSLDMSYKIVLDCCGLILEQYPDSPQAEKARELLQEVPEQYRKQYAEEMRPRLPSKPAVRKSRPLRRRP